MRGRARPVELHDGIITALSAVGGSAERVAVYVDGRRAFDVSTIVAQSAALRTDEFLTQERQTELLRDDEPYRAREMSLRMLASRDLACAEVVEKLLGRGISEQEASAAVHWLQERGYVDDAQYAAAYVSAKAAAGWGRQRVVSELSRKGLDRSVVDDAWQNQVERDQEGDKAERLAQLVRRRFGGQLASDPQGAKRRVSGFLARRGHDWQTIAVVMDALERDEGG